MMRISKFGIRANTNVEKSQMMGLKNCISTFKNVYIAKENINKGNNKDFLKSFVKMRKKDDKVEVNNFLIDRNSKLNEIIKTKSFE